MACGDNFYEAGVTGVDDPMWQKIWVDVFLEGPELRVPWMALLGNHDYGGSSSAQLNFTTSDRNPDGLWQMPGRVGKISLLFHAPPFPPWF
jgi:hypothetical protein